MRRAAVGVLATLSVAGLPAAAQPPLGSRDLPALLTQIGDRVEQYYARARSIACEETVRLQPLGIDLLPDGRRVRQLVYELRIAWDAPTDGAQPPEARVLRQIVSVDGRPARPEDEPGCMDPKPVSTEPLAMLLPSRRQDYAFSWAGTGRVGGRATVRLGYKSVSSRSAAITWKDECVSVELQGRSRGRVWVDPTTAQVLRLDEQLTGLFEFPVPKELVRRGSRLSLIIERADSSIRYRPVVFHDPDETVMLPDSVETLQVIRHAGIPRLRTTQTFSNYKRFITDARIVNDPGSR